MNPLDTDLPIIALKPGELYICLEPTLVHTLLGSCITVTMYSARLRIGGITHAMLPHIGGQRDGCDKNCPVACNDANPMNDAFRYVDSSIGYLLERFGAYGVKEGELEIKVFGGADMFDAKGMVTVGMQNIEEALKVISAKRLRLLVDDTGGREGRRLYFYTHTGEVLVRRIKTETGSLYGAYLKNLYSNYKK